MRTTIAFAAILSLGASLSATAGEVAGTVYDARGVPAAGVELVLEGRQAVSGADGTYRFTDVAAGDRMVSTSGQRVTVAVPEEGEATRNIILMSQRARLAVTGTTATPERAEEVFAEALQLADQMLASGSARGEATWRWNDHEG